MCSMHICACLGEEREVNLCILMYERVHVCMAVRMPPRVPRNNLSFSFLFLFLFFSFLFHSCFPLFFLFSETPFHTGISLGIRLDWLVIKYSTRWHDTCLCHCSSRVEISGFQVHYSHGRWGLDSHIYYAVVVPSFMFWWLLVSQRHARAD